MDAIKLLEDRLRVRPTTAIEIGISQRNGTFYCYLGNENGESDATAESTSLSEAIIAAFKEAGNA